MHERVDAGGGVERGNTGAAGAQALGDGALRGQLDRNVAGEVFLLEVLVRAEVGDDEAVDLPRFREEREPVVAGAGVVGDGGERVQRGRATAGDGFDDGFCGRAGRGCEGLVSAERGRV